MGKVILIILALGQIALAQNLKLSQDTLFPSEARYIYKNIDDAEIITSKNSTLKLSSLWNEKPIILTLIFSRCAGICSPLISSLKESIQRLGEDKKFDFYVVVLSFDARDTPDDMKAFSDAFDLAEKINWIFGVFADTALIKKFSTEVGFWYIWVDSTGQFDHPGMVVGIRQGKIVRILVGGEIQIVKLRELINELKGEFVPFYSIDKNVAFRCLNYDPETGKIKIGVGTVILFAPAFLTFLITFSIFSITNKNKQNQGGKECD